MTTADDLLRFKRAEQRARELDMSIELHDTIVLVRSNGVQQARFNSLDELYGYLRGYKAAVRNQDEV